MLSLANVSYTELVNMWKIFLLNVIGTREVSGEV